MFSDPVLGATVKVNILLQCNHDDEIFPHLLCTLLKHVGP